MAGHAYREEIYSRYLTAGFRRLNTLDYARSADSYGLNYDDIMPEDRGSRILDIGCGMGHFLYYAKSKGYRDFLGVDVGPEQVEFCRKNITDKAQKIEDIFAFLSDKVSCYDLVVLNDVLEHFSKADVLRLLKRVLISLKDNGRILIKTPNMANLLASASFHIDFTHETGFSEVSLAQVLNIAGFKEPVIRPEKVYISSPVKRIFFNAGYGLYKWFLKIIVILDRPGDGYPRIFSKNLIAYAGK